MKIKFIDNTPHLIPENLDEEDQLFNWYEKNKGKQVAAVISFNWYEKESVQTNFVHFSLNNLNNN